MTVTAITIRVGAGFAPRCAPRLSPGQPTLPSRVPRTGTRECPSHGCATGAAQTRAAGAVGSTASPAELSGGSFSRAAKPAAVTPAPTGLSHRHPRGWHRGEPRSGREASSCCRRHVTALSSQPRRSHRRLQPRCARAPFWLPVYQPRSARDSRGRASPGRTGRAAPPPALPLPPLFALREAGSGSVPVCGASPENPPGPHRPAPLRDSACSDGEPGQAPPRATPRCRSRSRPVPTPARGTTAAGGEQRPHAPRTPPALTRGPGGRGGGSR